MQEIDIIQRINELCFARSWSIYKLAKESDITYSTLFTMLHKASAPSIPTLIKLCDGFGITLADFFDTDNDRAFLSPAERKLLRQWHALTPQERRMADSYLQFLIEQQQK
jgi:transcriptional regulator with XRE-family HTH domain